MLAFSCWWLPLCRHRACHWITVTQDVPSYSQVLPLKPISTWLVTLKELWLPLCQDCKNSEFFLLLCTATLVAGNILFGDRRCILLSEEVMALVPKHVTVSLRMLFRTKWTTKLVLPVKKKPLYQSVNDAHELMVVAKLWSPFVRDVVFNVPTEENWKV